MKEWDFNGAGELDAGQVDKAMNSKWAGFIPVSQCRLLCHRCGRARRISAVSGVWHAATCSMYRVSKIPWGLVKGVLKTAHTVAQVLGGKTEKL